MPELHKDFRKLLEFLTAHHVIVNKRTAGRRKDLADTEALGEQ